MSNVGECCIYCGSRGWCGCGVKPDTERPIKWRRVHEYANSPRPEPMLQQELYKLLSAYDALEAEVKETNALFVKHSREYQEENASLKDEIAALRSALKYDCSPHLYARQKINEANEIRDKRNKGEK